MGRSDGGERGALWGRIWAVLPLERRAMWIITCHVEAGWKNANLFWRERSAEGSGEAGWRSKLGRSRAFADCMHTCYHDKVAGGGVGGLPWSRLL